MNPATKEILYNIALFSMAIAAVVGLYHLPKLKNSTWKWFIYYLIFIAFESIIIKFFVAKEITGYIYDYLIVPIEFFFFYWLYAIQSLKKKNLFWACIIVFLLSFLPHLYFKNNVNKINEMSYIVGCMLLFVLVIFEFIKQIKSDDILLFKQNKMFYINIGVVLFYIGSLPLLAFLKYLYVNERPIYDVYLFYFYLSNILMYLLFAASFIWGKSNT